MADKQKAKPIKRVSPPPQTKNYTNDPLQEFDAEDLMEETDPAKRKRMFESGAVSPSYIDTVIGGGLGQGARLLGSKVIPAVGTALSRFLSTHPKTAATAATTSVGMDLANMDESVPSTGALDEISAFAPLKKPLPPVPEIKKRAVPPPLPKKMSEKIPVAVKETTVIAPGPKKTLDKPPLPEEYLGKKVVNFSGKIDERAKKAAEAAEEKAKRSKEIEQDFDAIFQESFETDPKTELYFGKEGIEAIKNKGPKSKEDLEKEIEFLKYLQESNQLDGILQGTNMKGDLYREFERLNDLKKNWKPDAKIIKYENRSDPTNEAFGKQADDILEEYWKGQGGSKPKLKYESVEGPDAKGRTTIQSTNKMDNPWTEGKQSRTFRDINESARKANEATLKGKPKASDRILKNATAKDFKAVSLSDAERATLRQLYDNMGKPVKYDEAKHKALWQTGKIKVQDGKIVGITDLGMQEFFKKGK